MKTNYLGLCMFIPLLVACDSYLVPDLIDSRLPAYTESGLNVAGAYFNGEVWYAHIEEKESVFRVAYIYKTDQSEYVHFVLNGSLANNTRSAQFVFKFKEDKLKTPDNIVLLEGQTYFFDGVENQI